jgi:hypothetical protein
VRREELWAKHMKLNRAAIGNILEEHIGNIGNIFDKNPPPQPCHSKLTREKIKAL